MIFGRILNIKTFQIITRCVRNKGPYFHEVACYPQTPMMLVKALHTSKVCDGKIVYKKYVEPTYEDHDHKNMRLGRPMSPHVTDYAPTVPSLTSILQRMTGTILAFYAFMLASGSLFMSNGVDTYVSIIQSLNLSTPFIFLLKIIIGLPFSFHFFNGLRFIGFNMGKFLELHEAYKTAKQAVIAAGVLTLLFALR